MSNLRKDALTAIRALREWVQAVPDDTPLPTMPGVDGDWLDSVEAALAEPRREPVPSDGWLQDGSLLYRLTDEGKPQNRDEINVTMADGSRSEASRTRRAGELLDRIRANSPRREPLSDEQIHDIYDRIAKQEPYGVTRRNVVRAIEQAHGITGEKT